MNCCVLGAGAWGTAMALHLDRCGHSLTLVPRRMEHALSIASSRVNQAYLPGFSLPHRIQIGCEIGPVLMEADIVFFACPSKAIRELAESVRPHLKAAHQLKLCIVMCKGLELETFKTPAEILKESLPGLHYGVLSGPTFADEVAAGKPTAVVLALPESLVNPKDYQDALSNRSMRCYLTTDVRGTELGGTLKNIYAIGAGLCDGLQLGDNARAAYLTRSLNELLEVGTALGGQSSTFHGLSGFGDLVATCSGAWSRNRTFGQQVGQGESPEAIIGKQKTVVEGYRATDCLKHYCDKENIDAPILSTIHAVLYEGMLPEDGITALMSRELRTE